MPHLMGSTLATLSAFHHQFLDTTSHGPKYSQDLDDAYFAQVTAAVAFIAVC